MKTQRWQGLLNPHTDIERSEQDCLEARANLGSAQIELAELALKISELEKKRAEVYAAEKERINRALDRQRIDQAKKLATVLVNAAAHEKLRDIEDLYGVLGVGEIIADSLVWQEFLPP